MPREKIFLLGGGAVAREYWLPALKTHGVLRDVVVIDREQKAPLAYRILYPELKWIRADYKTYLARLKQFSDRDMAIVTLPNHLHVEASLFCAELGLHVLCEKPISFSSEQTREIENKFKNKKRFFAPAMARRYLPAYTSMKEALSSGKIGKIKHIKIEDGGLYSWIAETGAAFRKKSGGVFADMGVHYLDLLVYLLGEVEPVAYEDNYRGGVETEFKFKLRSGDIDITLQISWIQNLKNRFLIVGEKGSLEVQKDNHESCFLKVGEGIETLVPKLSFEAGAFSRTLHGAFIEEFYQFRNLIYGKAHVTVSIEDAKKVTALLEWGYGHQKVSLATNKPDAGHEKIVITGATGFVGRHLVERLVSEGFTNIHIGLRSFKNFYTVACFDLQVHFADLLDREAVFELIKEAKWVIHLGYGAGGADERRVTFEGTKNVVDACAEHEVPKLIFLSTFWVYGAENQGVVTEESRQEPRKNAYAESKWEAEKYCLQAAAENIKTKITILSPTCVYGPWGKTYSQLPYELVRNKHFVWIENGRGLCNYIYIDNLLDAILKTLDYEGAQLEKFLLNDGTCTWFEFLNPLLDCADSEIKSMTPEALAAMEAPTAAKSGAQILKELIYTLPFGSKLMGFLRELKQLKQKENVFKEKKAAPNPQVPSKGIPPVWLSELFGTEELRVDAARAKDLLKWEPRVNLEEGQQRTLAWLRKM